MIKGVSVSFGILVAALAIAEGIFRFTPYANILPFDAQIPNFYYDYADDGSYDHHPDFATSTHRFVDLSYPIWTNNAGCFDTRFEGGEPYILLLGDSFAWGFAPFEDKWGTVVEEETGMRVAKCGVVGYGTAAELTKAEKFITIWGAPETIVVAYNVDDAMQDLPRERVDQGPGRLFALDHFLRNHSVLYIVAKQEYLRYASRYGSEPQKYNTIRGPIPEEHEKSIRGFKKLADESGSEIFFVVIATKEAVRSPGRKENRPFALSIFESEGIPYLDLANAIHRYEELPERPLYWQIDPHWNSAGNHIVGSIVAEHLLREGFVSDQVSAQSADEIAARRQRDFPEP